MIKNSVHVDWCVCVRVCVCVCVCVVDGGNISYFFSFLIKKLLLKYIVHLQGCVSFTCTAK